MIAELCVFDMGSRLRRGGLAGWGPKRPFDRCKALKSNDLASLLFALMRAYARLYALMRAYSAIRALISPCEALGAPRLSHG